jgi:DNA-binding transcriptional MerR regulator
VERLRKVVELRQRRYLPLGAVKHILQKLDADPTYDLTLYDEIFRSDEYDSEFRHVTRTEAGKRTGFTAEQIERFEQMGFLPTRDERGKRRRFDEGDLKVLVLLRDLLAVGLALEDLVFYVKDIRDHVQHEIAFLGRVMGDCEGRPERHALYRQMQQAVGQLRALLYRRYGRQAIAELLEEA